MFRLIKRKAVSVLAVIALIISAAVLSSCSAEKKKPVLRALIIPKFEEGEMSGDFPGEAQLFYEEYCAGCEETEIPNMPDTGHFYYNEKNGVGILVTGSSKSAAGFSLITLLASDLYDYSDAYLVSVGCAGGSLGYVTLGDVVLVTAACDYDLGHHVDPRDMMDPDAAVTWFSDESFSNYEFKYMDQDLCGRVYELIKDCPLQTTEMAATVLQRNYPNWEGAYRQPAVYRGTALSGDNYWKGAYNHVTANYMAKYYGCPDPYAVSEMEEIAIANAASYYGLLDRMISLRVVVNMDVFMDTDYPENMWTANTDINQKFTEENTETLDVFEPAMHNLFDAGRIVIDAVLDGTI